MNSSIEQLRDALALLVNDSKGDGNGLADAGKAARDISNSFSGVNYSLTDGWSTASDFFYKIQNGVVDLCSSLYNDINDFVEETQMLEIAAQQAVEKANDTARQILDELGLNGLPVGGFKPLPVYYKNE